jgi:hypothetical protein
MIALASTVAAVLRFKGENEMKTLVTKALLVICAMAFVGSLAGQADAFWGHRRPVTTAYALPSVPVTAAVPVTVGYAPVAPVVVARPVVVGSPFVAAPIATPPVVASYAPVATTPVTSYYPPPTTTYYAPAAPVAPATTTYYAPATTTYYAPAAAVVPATTTYYAPAAGVILRRPFVIVP